mgnify:CR=1 FL=1
MTRTKGNVIVEEIKVWKSKNINSDKEIDYLVNPKYSHYSVNLYDYEAYEVKHYI